MESLTAELAKTYEYFADKMVQLQNELKQQKESGKQTGVSNCSTNDNNF